MVKITEDKFNRYVKVEMSGKYNMMMDRDKAMAKADLTQREYETIQRDYIKLDKAWSNNENKR